MRSSSLAWSRTLELLSLGAIAFWWTDTLVHAIRGLDFKGRDVLVLTASMPLSFLLTFHATKRCVRGRAQRRVGLLMIVGVWLFSGLFMMLNASFSGGGFRSPEGIGWLVRSILLSVIPVYTYVLATYDGSLAALLIVTLGGCVFSAVQSRWQ
jgi:hypothetical protein